jgi:hypothetical protein
VAELDLQPSPDGARGSQRARIRFRWLFAVLIAPLGLYLLGLKNNYLQSVWWAGLRPFVWATVSAVYAGVVYSCFANYRESIRSLPEAKRPKGLSRYQRIGLRVLVVLFAIAWVDSVQSIILTRMLHVVSSPAPATVAAKIVGTEYEYRGCDTYVVVAAAG